MKVIPDEVFASVLSALRSYQFGNASIQLAETVADRLVDEVMIVAEGCTPTDARVLRTANHAFAEKVQNLERALEPFTRHLSSEHETTITVKSDFIRHARMLIAP